jgi:hypothetical protein
MSHRVTQLHSIDLTIGEIKVEDGDELFGSVLGVASGGSVAVDSAGRQAFQGIGADLWHSELSRSLDPQLGDQFAMKKILDSCRRLGVTFPQRASSLRHISTVSYLVAVRYGFYLCQ